jgi:triacylglycerol lipase
LITLEGRRALVAQVNMLFAVVVALWLVAAIALAAAAWPRRPGAIVEAPAELAAPAIIRRPQRPGVVLVHGLMGFDQLGVGPTRVDYFRGVAQALEAAGLDVITARLSPLGGVPARAAQLARAMEQQPHDRFVVIGHSMGGLDARWAVAREGLAARTAAVVTIGTPHRGTPIADLLASRPLGRARKVMARLGLSSDAIDWLTTTRLEILNRELGDVAGVRYASVITATADRARVHPLLRATHAYLARAHGPSDGLVPRSSQLWGEILAEEEIDHWAQIGWSSSHDAGALLLRALATLGALPPDPRRALMPAQAA